MPTRAIETRTVRTKGPWSAPQIKRYLAASRVPLRLAANGTAGHPVLASLWFVPLAGRLWCATPRSAAIAKLLARDPRCAIEVAQETAPYRGVRGSALATLDEMRGEEILDAATLRYLGTRTSPFARWLLGRAQRETAISLEPQTWVSWDFTQRMGDVAG